MKTRPSVLFATVGFAASVFSGCAGISNPFGSSPQSTVVQAGDERLTCTQLTQEANGLTDKIRELDSKRQKAVEAQKTAQMAEQAGQLASVTSNRNGTLSSISSVIGRVSSGASASAANLEASYQTAVMRKQHVDRLLADKNCARKKGTAD